MHKDQVLHLKSIMQSPRLTFDTDDSRILGRLGELLLLRKRGEIKDFARTAFSIFTQHPRFAALARICLVLRQGLANQLFAISVEHKGQSPNTMEVGYSCYVDANGSLFRLGMTDVRTFGSAERVVESYRIRGVPTQRSIGRIHAMGLESGFCLPLFGHEHNIGFLFMNGVTGDLFSLDDSPDAIIYSYFGTICTLILQDAASLSKEYYGLGLRNRTSYQGALLTGEALKATLETHLSDLDHGCEIQTTVAPPPTLCSLGNIANIISRTLKLYACTKASLHVARDQDQLHWRVVCEGQHPFTDKFAAAESLWSDCAALQLKLVAQDRSLTFQTPFEPVKTEWGISYST
ncbi:MAG TPA: hypothetical protein VFO10_22765 [Oligoflexus sp.]|uniref:hypothetical protein n=1 Tax=Oligoflexus sp. TaxID=1971216 RepID=UPI002D7F92D4|nr:hypothetical protein [Oligoflexus sp.]HET9240103.1 hypothetical protein [Oligoflexus sp.]